MSPFVVLYIIVLSYWAVKMADLCCDFIEPCHASECAGVEEVQALLPNGRIWDISRNSTSSRYFRAVAHIKSSLNMLLCQQYEELEPCKSVRLFDYYTKLYSLPPCAPQTQESLCEWIGIIYDKDCPIGSLGFYQKVIDFISPNNEITLTLNLPDIFSHEWRSHTLKADEAHLIVTAPPNSYNWFSGPIIEGYSGQDGQNPDRKYFIPEIECLKRCIFPFGLSIGYKTDPSGPNGEDISGVGDERAMNNIYNVPQC